MRALYVRFIAFIFLPLMLAGVYFSFTLSFGLPQAEGEISVKGLEGDANIHRDEHGVVHINSGSDNGVFFAMGFAHAQDRLWQLELQRRLAQGRMSEVFGARLVNADAQMRTLDLYGSARSAWDALTPQAQSSLSAYSAGINAWLDSTDSFPPEFFILDVHPEPWTELDSLAWTKVFALNLAANMWDEIARFIVRPYLSDAQFSELFSGYPTDAPVTVTDEELEIRDAMAAMEALQQEFREELNVGGKFVGSNAWVISRELTDSDQTILANDPHLGIQIPSMFYMANLSGDKINASGMTLVGLPVVIFGRNQNIAWGGTNMMADTQDLYFEQVNGNNSKQYLNDGQWLEFKTQKHYIEVRPEFPTKLREEIEPVEVVVRSTIRGPVVSDVFGLSDQPVTLRWTGLSENDTTYESFFRLNYADNWESFKLALSHHIAPSLNILYSDKAGNIGFMGVGKIPIRNKGQGQAPVTGGSSEHQWTGYIPFEEMPQSYNPEKGFIVSANNKVVDDFYPYHITHDWAPSDSAERITQLIERELDEHKTLSIEYMEKMQGDTVSYGATRLIKLLTSVPMKTEQQKLAQEYVSQWDGDMSIHSQGASIFYGWARQLRKVLFADNLRVSYGRESQAGLLSRAYGGTTYAQIAEALTPGGAQWCDDVNTEVEESCRWAIEHALDRAIKELSKLAGSDMNDWEWGAMHSTLYAHQPFSEVNLFKSFFERRIASGGGPNTINLSGAGFVESEGFIQTYGASFRQIIGFGEKGVDHRYMNSTGQSENVFSPHYDDMVEPFRDVRYLDMSKAKIEAKLVLKGDAKTTSVTQR